MVLTKILVFLFIMSILNLLREALYIVKCFRTLCEYKIGNWRTFLLWGSVSYIITILILGL